MAVYPPPSFQSNIFDTNAFNQSDGTAGLTEAEANLLYYKYPVGQATQTLQQTDHTGLASFQAGIDINVGTLKFPDNTVQTTAAGSGGGETLAQTLVLGNSAGATDINMNNNDITNCATLNNVILTTGVVATNLEVGFLGQLNYNNTTTGNGHNTAMGDNIMTSITTGNYNNAVGSFACNKITDGEGNEGFGSSALQNQTTADYNTAIGNRAGEKQIAGSYNVYVGAQAGQNVTTGSYNTFVGQAAGQNSSGASNNTYVGSGTSILGGVSNSTVLGIGATTSTAHTVQLGTVAENVNCPNTLSVANTLTMNGSTDLKRIINNVYYQFQDKNALATTIGQIYGSSGAIIFDNDINSGSYSFAVNNSVSVQSIPLSFDAVNFNISTTNPPTCSATQPASSDSSTKVPTTAWVQGAISAYVPSGGSATTLAQIGGYNSATGLAFPSTVNITVPANAVYADIFLAGVGGGAGFGGDRSAGGYYTGGSGGGATATYGRVFCKGLALSVFQASNQVCLSVGGITVVKVWNGSQGGSASASAGGVGGVANSNATVISVSGYSSWFSYNGGAGANGGTNSAPASVGTILLTGYNASTLLGCGQSISTSGGGNPYAFQTTYFGGAYITYYTL